MYQPSTVRVPSVTTVDAAAIPPSLTDYPVPFHHPPISNISSDLPGRWWLFSMCILKVLLICGVGKNWRIDQLFFKWNETICSIALI